jgi:biotin carboxyl carrier protein
MAKRRVVLAKVVALRARPSVYADLSFETGGIIASSNVQLGQSVSQFDFTDLYAALGVQTEAHFKTVRTAIGGEQGVVVSDPADLLNSSDLSLGLATGADAPALMTLRAEGVKAALDRACALRAKQYYTTYGNQAAIIKQMSQSYTLDPKPNESSKNSYLSALAKLSAAQLDGLENAYHNDPFSPQQPPGMPAGAPPAGRDQGQVMYSSPSSSHFKSTTYPSSQSDNPTSNMQQDMTSDSHGYGYRMPYIEAQAQNARAQANLIDEKFSQFLVGQTIPNLDAIYTNQLTAINMNVKRFQVAYLATILLSPIAGTVTAIYKQVGEAVQAGEKVLRIEDNTAMLLYGRLICAEMIPLNSSIRIESYLFSGTTTEIIEGTIVAVRGDAAGDDNWNVIISCQNTDRTGNPILPLNYHFDTDSTQNTRQTRASIAITSP